MRERAIKLGGFLLIMSIYVSAIKNCTCISGTAEAGCSTVRSNKIGAVRKTIFTGFTLIVPQSKINTSNRKLLAHVQKKSPMLVIPKQFRI